MVSLRYGFSFGEDGDDFVGWGGFATKGDMFANATKVGDISYNGATYAHFIYYFCVLNLVPTIVAGLSFCCLRISFYVIYQNGSYLICNGYNIDNFQLQYKAV